MIGHSMSQSIVTVIDPHNTGNEPEKYTQFHGINYLYAKILGLYTG